MVAQNAADAANRYGIGVVSRLTGVSRDALRVWERRYGVVKAERTETKRRLYTQDDIKRLMLVKALVDSGHPISSVANLQTRELEERLRTDAATQPKTPQALHETPARVVMVGPSLSRLLQREPIEVDALHVIAALNHVEELKDRAQAFEADVLVIERSGLFDDTIDEALSLLQESGARRVVIVYGFASRKAIANVRKNAPKVIGLRAPVNVTELRLACLMDVDTAAVATRPDTHAGETPARVFTEEQLAAISSASSTVQCECPQHLVSLVTSLSAFEAYSKACENRNPDDAALHAHLHSVTARSRRFMEEALAAVAAAEGIRIGNSD